MHLSSREFESECEPVRSTWSTMWRAPAADSAWQLGHLPPGFEHELSWLRAGGEEQDREFAYWVLGVGASDILSDRLTAELKREQMHFLRIIEMARRRWVKFDQVIP